jgi:hypothetical protein
MTTTWNITIPYPQNEDDDFDKFIENDIDVEGWFEDLDEFE